MRRVSYIALLIALKLLILSCNSDNSSVKNSTEKKRDTLGLALLIDSLLIDIETNSGEYFVPSKNEEFKSFLQEKLLKHIFEQLYSGKLKAYDFATDSELSVKEIKDIESEEGFSLTKVGKVQFIEQWYIDRNGVLNKRVNSMTFGIESYSNQGNFMGYKALFKIKF